MNRKQYISILFLLLTVSFSQAQEAVRTFGTGGNELLSPEDYEGSEDQDTAHQHDEPKKKQVPSFIRNWQLSNYGANIEEAEFDTTLNFFHVYNPVFQRSISNTFTGNTGGAYQSNDFFNRKPVSDFYFYRSYDAYAKFPATIKFFNTTTPYTLLDYTQSENRNSRNETRFNVLHSQNVNKDFNFTLFYDQSKSTGHYQNQEAKFHNIGINTTYLSDKFNSHFHVIFNRYESQENGGLTPGQDLNEYEETETYLVNLLNAASSVKNNIVAFTNEYKLGKTEEKETEDGYLYDSFRPITGFIHQFEYSTNQRRYLDSDPHNADVYKNVYRDETATSDTTIYNRLTNVFQLKFYEAPERKFTFTQRAYIGNDLITVKMLDADSLYLSKENLHNTFIGGGISRDEGKFWRWNAQGKMYLTGYRSGQTELSGFIYKPLKIGSDTTSLYLSGEINSLVPDYFQQHYRSNNYEWDNRFSNINELTIRGQIRSQKYKLELGANHSLISNYIYNDQDALPNQGGSELLVLSAYVRKDFESKHWLLRTHLLWQTSSQEDYLHLPELTGYLSFNFKTVISKVLYTNLGFDVRYHSLYYADAFDPATGRFYWQNQQKIGNFPFVDLHANLKLKRTRAFFQLLNAASGLMEGNYWTAPDYPLYRRTFRLGIAWSFYD
ncbi:putative porin [Gaoshiqia sp. Z1-71]|uniref:putative porin n=1 Tax=Gaoshiqia hydrogeniformans TaxID=3290090 RepID=UPI003BF8D601